MGAFDSRLRLEAGEVARLHPWVGGREKSAIAAHSARLTCKSNAPIERKTEPVWTRCWTPPCVLEMTSVVFRVDKFQPISQFELAGDILDKQHT